VLPRPGGARLREVFAEAVFSRFRQATETPFNLILQARTNADGTTKRGRAIAAALAIGLFSLTLSSAVAPQLRLAISSASLTDFPTTAG
jgi:hypothetical protein